jgi:YfiR/HmsC-like
MRVLRRLNARLALACLTALVGSLGLARLSFSQASLPPRSGRDISLEYQVKAAYLLNFTRYVEWPSRTLEPAVPVTICVLGRDPFGSVLDATVSGRTTQGRSVIVRRVRAASETAGCHLVFISRETWQNQRDLPRGLQSLGLLTVGESEEFAQAGGIIGFIIRNEAVRFVVNARASDRAGLRISSRMLSLAAAIYGQRSGS